MDTSTDTQVVKRGRTTAPPIDGIDIDLNAWRATSAKLSLRETGELVRALVRAHAAVRPNREQRMLLAIFMRDPDTDEVTA